MKVAKLITQIYLLQRLREAKLNPHYVWNMNARFLSRLEDMKCGDQIQNVIKQGKEGT
jgi:hypothetical protein